MALVKNPDSAQKWKLSKEYDYETLIRDLIDYTQQLEKKLAYTDARLAAAGIPVI